MKKGDDLLKVNIAQTNEGKNLEKVFWVNQYITPENVGTEFQAFLDKPIPRELDLVKTKPNSCVFEVFAINANKFKEKLVREEHDRKKAAGLVPLDAPYPQSLLYTADSSGNINSEWVFFPIAKILRLNGSEEQYNPLGIKEGDIVRLTDSLAWRAENPVYKKFISDHPYPEAIGLIQVTATPQQFIYNMIEGNSGLARDAFNVNPFSNRWYGFVFMKLVSEFSGVIAPEDAIKMIEIAGEKQELI